MRGTGKIGGLNKKTISSKYHNFIGYKLKKNAFHCLGKVWAIEPSCLDMWVGISKRETYGNLTLCSVLKPRLNVKNIYRIIQQKKILLWDTILSSFRHRNFRHGEFFQTKKLEEVYSKYQSREGSQFLHFFYQKTIVGGYFFFLSKTKK